MVKTLCFCCREQGAGQGAAGRGRGQGRGFDPQFGDLRYRLPHGVARGKKKELYETLKKCEKGMAKCESEE